MSNKEKINIDKLAVALKRWDAGEGWLDRAELKEVYDQKIICDILGRVTAEAIDPRYLDVMELFIQRCVCLVTISKLAKTPVECSDGSIHNNEIRSAALVRMVELEKIQGLDIQLRQRAEMWLQGRFDWLGLPKREHGYFRFYRSVKRIGTDVSKSKTYHGHATMTHTTTTSTYDLGDYLDHGVRGPKASKFALSLFLTGVTAVIFVLIISIPSLGFFVRDELGRIAPGDFLGELFLLFLMGLPPVVLFAVLTFTSPDDALIKEIDSVRGKNTWTRCSHEGYNKWVAGMSSFSPSSDSYEQHLRERIINPVHFLRYREGVLKKYLQEIETELSSKET